MSKKRQTVNPRHSLFANYYVATLDRIEAAKKAGYKGDYATLAVTASRLLKDANVLRAINELLQESAIPAYEVLLRLGEMARADIGDVLDEKGNLDLKKARELKRTGQIKRIKQRQITTEESDIFETEVEMYDAQGALNTFMKHYGLLVERVKVDDWRSEIIGLLKEGKVTPEQVEAELGKSLAQGLFESIGLSVTSSGENGTA